MTLTECGFNPTRVRLKRVATFVSTVASRCFNPTRVRLKHDDDCDERAADHSLQPHKGSSETTDWRRHRGGDESFNPTRVRLKRHY